MKHKINMPGIESNNPINIHEIKPRFFQVAARTPVAVATAR